MTRLLHDRYYRHADDAVWDLATGEQVPIERIANAPPTSAPTIGPISEVFGHGREGEPRWIVVDTSARQTSRALLRRTADDARLHGLVPIAADVYLRLRPLLDEDLRQRTLLLIVGPGGHLEVGRRALLEAAERSPRPHVLLSFRCAMHTEMGASARVVREARSVYSARGPALPPGTPPARVPEDVARQVARGVRWVELCRTGRHAAAERRLRDVAGALVRRRAFEAAANTLVTLGRLLLERGRASDADRVFGDAAGHVQAVAREDLVVDARIWQASARTDAGQLTAAESLCRAALVVGSLDESVRARAEAALARVLLWQNRIDEAATRSLPLALEDDEVTAVVGDVAVRVLVARGELFAAGQRVRDLLARTEGSANPLVQVIVRVAHLRVLLETGDLVRAQEGLVRVAEAAKSARTPFRYLRARLLWLDALRRAGRVRDAERELRDLQRLRRAAPPLLAGAIDGRLRPGTTRVPAPPPGSSTAPAARLVALARDEEQDRDAVREVLRFVSSVLGTSRLDVCSGDAGPDSTVVTVGSGLPTRVGSRVLDAGIAIDECAGAGGELGVPVRVGPRLVAALVARWPADRVAPPQARELLELAASVAAPRVEAMRVAGLQAAAAAASLPELLGASAAMTEVRRAVTRAASAPFSVLIEGESGSGKELVARALHQLSPRRERRFCDLNCAALPDELVEAELFGHTRGAFTGAVADRPGLLEEADGGTLFLDEVADLSPRAQAKLLRVLQQQEVRRVGATVSKKIDVRVVSAANRDMRSEVVGGRFRQDLIYRLDVIRIRVPPLRERPEDIAVLARHFWQIAAERIGTRATLSHALLAALARYEWPGNVRELQNVIAGLAVASPANGLVRPGLLPAVMTLAQASPMPLAAARSQFERRFVEMALARAGGRRARAARELGLTRQGLLKLMTRLGLAAG